MENVNCLRCHFRHEDNGNCTAVGGFCAAHCPLLREYLDTELTPNEIERSKLEIEAGCVKAIARTYGIDINRLRKLAEADVAPVVHGRWENGNPICPVCGENKFKDLDADIWCDWKPDYCPNCGAKMDEGDDNACL